MQEEHSSEIVQKIKFIDKHYKEKILPIAKDEWLYWHRKAKSIMGMEARSFIKKCLEAKRLHPLGASIYAVPLKKTLAEKVARWCVSLQVLADLLDSESEREETTPKIVQQMHCLMLDFVRGGKVVKAHYPTQQRIFLDISYIKQLVKRGRGLNSLPAYNVIRAYLFNSIKNYSKAQVHSSLPPQQRDELNKKWAKNTNLRWFEYYASQTSTLPIFALISLAANKKHSKELAKQIYETHHLWLSILHIMLNHLKGLDEDKRRDTINYVTNYGNEEQIKKRLVAVFRKAKSDLQGLPNSVFYLFVLRTLVEKYTRYRTKYLSIARALRKEAMID